ncbi:hypothetical protein [Anatilimnocola floriformis]|uniref:hypothetical protein n=1 Tax=Anatilimnocola floriformis TaxID=2948575 RepID=UPI0020C48563|nr:hypothetical protein [Anatilimnocola floriformis]
MNATFPTLDPSLRQFADAANQEPISVIVEVVADAANAPYAIVRKGLPVAKHERTTIEERGTRTQTKTRSPMDQLELLLKNLNVPNPVRLDSAESFVARVNPDQLKELAGSDLVGKIRPNRQHHT